MQSFAPFLSVTKTRSYVPFAHIFFFLYVLPNQSHSSRFKSSALSLSRIHRSHPIPPALRLIQWVEHILHSRGGAHLKPTSLTLPWYQRYMLDLLFLFSLVLFGLVVICCRCIRTKTSRDKDCKQE